VRNLQTHALGQSQYLPSHQQQAVEWRCSWLRKNRGWICVHELHAFLERACSWFGEDGGRLKVVVDGVMSEALLC
jgi:hypothetical protein